MRIVLYSDRLRPYNSCENANNHVFGGASYTVEGFLSQGNVDISSPTIEVRVNDTFTIKKALTVVGAVISDFSRSYNIVSKSIVNDGRVVYSLEVDLCASFGSLLKSASACHRVIRTSADSFNGETTVFPTPRADDEALINSERGHKYTKLDFHNFFTQNQNYVAAISNAWAIKGGSASTAQYVKLSNNALKETFLSRTIWNELPGGQSTTAFIPISVGKDMASLTSVLSGSTLESAFKGLFSDMSSAVQSIRWYPLDLYTGSWRGSSTETYTLGIGGTYTEATDTEAAHVNGATVTGVKCGRPIGTQLCSAWLWSGQLIDELTDSAQLDPITTYDLYLPYADRPMNVNPIDVAGKSCSIVLDIDYTTGRGIYTLILSDGFEEEPSVHSFDAAYLFEKIGNDAASVVIARVEASVGTDIPIGFANGSDRLRNAIMMGVDVGTSIASGGATTAVSTVVKKRSPATGRMRKETSIETTTSSTSDKVPEVMGSVSAGVLSNAWKCTNMRSSALDGIFSTTDGLLHTSTMKATMPDVDLFGRAICPIEVTGDQIKDAGAYYYKDDELIFTSIAKPMTAKEVDALRSIAIEDGFYV